jgi:general secretion pathway protein K
MMNKSLIIVKEAAAKEKVADARPRERGVALLLTLLISVILSVVVLEFNYIIRVHATLSGHFVDDLKARAAAEAGVQTAKALLLNDLIADSEGELKVDAPDELWAADIELGHEPGKHGPRTTARITDEMSKFNLNRLVKRAETEAETESTNAKAVEIARRLFESLDIDSDLVDKIVDWIDENDEQEPFGAESAYYESLESPIQCKNGPLDSVEELLLIEDFNKEILYGSEDAPGLFEFVTICGDEEGRVNINTAPELLIAAITNSESDAAKIVELREGAPFEDGEDMAARVPEADLAEDFTTHSSFFMVTSIGSLFGGDDDSGDSPVRRVEITTLLKRISGDDAAEGDYFKIGTISWKADK